MAVAPGHGGGEGVEALVAVDELHQRRLADDGGGRPRQGRRQVAQQPADAEAADLLVEGQGEIDRHAQPGGLEFRHQRQRDGKEALHVGGAAAIEAVVVLDDGEGIALPGLAGHGHDVGVAGEHDAAGNVRSDGGEQVGLLAVRVEGQPAVDAEILEVVADVMDQRQVGVDRHRVEADQTADQIERRLAHGKPHKFGICAVAELPTMERNSRRVDGSLRKLPSMWLVTMLMPGLCTPRVVMHWCAASMMTPTPRGCSTSWMVLATWAVSFSWICSRRA